jgi:hypothetical protein
MGQTLRMLLDICRRERYVVAIVLLVPLLAGVNWILSPDRALRWLRLMLLMPALWFGLTLWSVLMRRSKRASGGEDETARERYYHAALSLGVVVGGVPLIVVLGLNIWFSIGDHGADLEVGRRIVGFTMGGVFVFFGNVLPKILTPLSILPPDLAQRVTSARRFIGRNCVILGLAIAIAALVLPFELVRVLMQWGAIAAVLSIVAGIVWMNAGPARRER